MPKERRPEPQTVTWDCLCPCFCRDLGSLFLCWHMVEKLCALCISCREVSFSPSSSMLTVNFTFTYKWKDLHSVCTCQVILVSMLVSRITGITLPTPRYGLWYLHGITKRCTKEQIILKSLQTTFANMWPIQLKQTLVWIPAVEKNCLHFQCQLLDCGIITVIQLCTMTHENIMLLHEIIMPLIHYYS